MKNIKPINATLVIFLFDWGSNHVQLEMVNDWVNYIVFQLLIYSWTVVALNNSGTHMTYLLWHV